MLFKCIIQHQKQYVKNTMLECKQHLKDLKIGDIVIIYDYIGNDKYRFIKTDKVLSVSKRIIKTATARYSRTYGYMLPKDTNTPYFIVKSGS